jgi:outer membrane protein TolC
LLPLIKDHVKAGLALPSDQARVEADVVRRTAERVRALEDVRNASAELARVLHLDPSVFLLPVDDFRWPVPVPGDQLQSQPLEVLVAEALRARPELAENAALIDAQVARYRAAKWRPLLPVAIASLSWGEFGGGPAIVGRTSSGGNIFGHSGIIDSFSNRTDIDVGLLWRLNGLGLGNFTEIKDRRIAVEQAQVRQMQIQDLVMSQVVRTVESIRRARQRVQVCRAGLFDEENKPTGAIYLSLRLNFIRIYGAQGLPLEVLDSTRRLTDVLGAYADALTDYDRARFRLITALGLTGLALEPPAPMAPATAPAPVAPPPPGR